MFVQIVLDKKTLSGIAGLINNKNDLTVIGFYGEPVIEPLLPLTELVGLSARKELDSDSRESCDSRVSCEDHDVFRSGDLRGGRGAVILQVEGIGPGVVGLQV